MLTLRAIRAETSHVELAQLPPDMSLAASWTFLAEAFVVVFAHGQFRAFLDVDIQALITILAVPILIEELAFAHLSQVVFVEVVAGIPLLAQALQPVFADIVIVCSAVVMLCLLRRGRMSVGTSSAEGT